MNTLIIIIHILCQDSRGQLAVINRNISTNPHASAQIPLVRHSGGFY